MRTIDALAPAGLELVEEPVHGLQAVREVRERVAVRVAIDETAAAEHGALGAGVADAVCLKISRCGGISGLIAAATLVRASGAEAYIASTLDGPLGIAAAVHAAAALASRGPVPHCGLATLGLFEDLENPLPARAGRIAVPTGGGLGVDPLGLRDPQRLHGVLRNLWVGRKDRHVEQSSLCDEQPVEGIPVQPREPCNGERMGVLDRERLGTHQA